jgi:hypothetical protein
MEKIDFTDKYDPNDSWFFADEEDEEETEEEVE